MLKEKTEPGMITRIVKMEFKYDQVDLFLEKFSRHAEKMKTVTGQVSLQIVKDLKESNILFTISEWHSEEDLNIYRSSFLFKQIWSEVKPLFCAKAQAWTTQSIYHARN